MTKAITSAPNVGELAAGQVLSVPLFTFKGTDNRAPTVYVQANVHGAEVHNT
ncbi:hypothetical protein ORI98_14120 [Shewanella sp. ULN5]|uniref:hypothetical protein n=1 Tax=Shewanella sp. ULN5 TaxID=2994678 RepID=UPI00273F38C4|nr:hypothetical protein [Shewanella sp. ULN5]MDP5147575.1 hypothetical protein [Shewanella sp. ULN5]